MCFFETEWLRAWVGQKLLSTKGKKKENKYWSFNGEKHQKILLHGKESTEELIWCGKMKITINCFYDQQNKFCVIKWHYV